MKVKKIDIFLLKTFFPLFFMTFGICLFIVLMQFLWKYIDEMVGKGLEITVLAEMFSYAALSFVPMALPLAILLASLITFGNLGENFELLAIKAAGISLLRIMKPLAIFLCFVAASSFYFQNNVIPLSQVKMWTLLYSMKHKSPELEIPESTFYNQIPGYNVFVKKKDLSGLLKEVMIYNYSEGFESAQVTVADSGRLKVSSDKLHLVLTLFNGESFENFKNKNEVRSAEAVPYMKESFETKEFLIKFDGNFNRADESIMQGRYIGKNLADLSLSIDSMTAYIDSVKEINASQIYAQSYLRNLNENESTGVGEGQREIETTELNWDELYQAQPPGVQMSMLHQVKSSFEMLQSDYSFKSTMLSSDEKEMRRHHTEMHKKFTLSLACLIFFFIGAPLGAIIRKGGLGMPAVISVVLFIFYYVIDNVGLKMSVNGMWQPWQGMWLSTTILLPLGVFLTYKANNDSVLFNTDTHIYRFKKLLGMRMTRKIQKKEVIIYQLDYRAFSSDLLSLKDACTNYLAYHTRWQSYFAFWKNKTVDKDAEELSQCLEKIVEEGANSDQNLVLNKLMDFPVVSNYVLMHLPDNKMSGEMVGWFFPAGVPLYLLGMYRRKILVQDIKTTRRICGELQDLINTM